MRREQHHADVHADQQAGHECVGHGPADQPVDLVQPVLQDPDTDPDGQGADPDPGYVPRHPAAEGGAEGEADQGEEGA
jgi:hypothetical protein